MLPNFSNLNADTSNPNDENTTPLLPYEIIAHILLLDEKIQYSIDNAKRVIRDQFYVQDGKQAIQLLCRSLKRLVEFMQVLPPSYHEFVIKKRVEIVSKLELFVNHVEGWVKSSPEFEDVVAMCAELDELFARAAEKQLPPPLSRMRAQRQSMQYFQPVHRPTGVHESGIKDHTELLDLQYDVWATYQLYFNSCYESLHGKGYYAYQIEKRANWAISKLIDAEFLIRTTGKKTIVFFPDVLQAWTIFCKEIALPFFRSSLPKGADLSYMVYMEEVSDKFKEMSHDQLKKVLDELSAVHQMCLLTPNPSHAVKYDESDIRP